MPIYVYMYIGICIYMCVDVYAYICNTYIYVLDTNRAHPHCQKSLMSNQKSPVSYQKNPVLYLTKITKLDQLGPVARE